MVRRRKTLQRRADDIAAPGAAVGAPLKREGISYKPISGFPNRPWNSREGRRRERSLPSRSGRYHIRIATRTNASCDRSRLYKRSRKTRGTHLSLHPYPRSSPHKTKILEKERQRRAGRTLRTRSIIRRSAAPTEDNVHMYQYFATKCSRYRKYSENGHRSTNRYEA